MVNKTRQQLIMIECPQIERHQDISIDIIVNGWLYRGLSFSLQMPEISCVLMQCHCSFANEESHVRVMMRTTWNAQKFGHNHSHFHWDISWKSRSSRQQQMLNRKASLTWLHEVQQPLQLFQICESVVQNITTVFISSWYFFHALLYKCQSISLRLAWSI